MLRNFSRRLASKATAPPFVYQELVEGAGPAPDTQWKRIESAGTPEVVSCGPRGNLVKVTGDQLAAYAREGTRDVSHLLRTSHLKQLRKIFDHPEASDNDRFVALELLKNANVASGMILPGCQDTGTAIVVGKKGQDIWTDNRDAEHLSRGIYQAYTEGNLRYSQVAPQTMFEEVNTGTNLPAQIDIFAGGKPSAYDLLLFTKGGGSANKTFLYQETKRLLNEENLEAFIREKIQTLGTSACPPYHLALVIGGTSAELNLKLVKLASARHLDSLPTSGNEHGRAYRDLEWEARVMEIAADLGIGAQFGGRFFCHDARVIRLPRHGASCPVGLGVSCSADRQICGKIDETGVYVEQLERDPAQFLPGPEELGKVSADPVRIDLDMPMEDIRRELSRHAVGTRVSLSGTLVVARDAAHAKFLEALNRGEQLPEAISKHAIFYAGPAKTPEGGDYAVGSLGATTSGRMDPALITLAEQGASLVTLAKGNRSRAVTKSLKKHGGYYLATIGGPGALLAKENIKSEKVIAFPELGFESVREIRVENFPAMIAIGGWDSGDGGGDFYSKWAM